MMCVPVCEGFLKLTPCVHIMVSHCRVLYGEVSLYVYSMTPVPRDSFSERRGRIDIAAIRTH